MTYSAVAKNTKIESIVFHTISSKVVPFAQASPIGSLAIRVLFAEVVNSMRIKKVSDYQKEYDKLKAIAESSMNANVELDDSFYNELLRLTKLVKSFGGKV
jgi:hypothetical protein